MVGIQISILFEHWQILVPAGHAAVDCTRLYLVAVDDALGGARGTDCIRSLVEVPHSSPKT